MNNEATRQAFNVMSKNQYALDDAITLFERSRKSYIEELKKECIENILRVANEEGKLTERDLNIFIGSMLSYVTNNFK